MTDFCYVDFPLGRLLLRAEDGALAGLDFVDGRYRAQPKPDWRHAENARPFDEVRRQLREYSEGRRTSFALALRPSGTTFQRRVWNSIADIPFGRTVTYLELATRSASAQSSRAAGLATGRNPISIIIPCHRVIGSDGSLTGYGGGLHRKRVLLEFEAAIARGRRATLEGERLFDEPVMERA